MFKKVRIPLNALNESKSGLYSVVLDRKLE